MSVLFALIPLVVAAVMLVGLRCNSREAGAVTLLVTIALTVLFPPFRLSVAHIVLALGTEIATVCTAMIILFPALLFFQVQKATRIIDTLMWGIDRIMPERDLQTLLLVFGLGPCIEAMCGFGIGALLILPFLVVNQQKKFNILSLSLLTQLLVPWGGFGYVTTLAATQSGLSAGLLGAHTALLLFPVALGAAFLALLLSGGKGAVLRYWSLAVAVVTMLIGGIWFFSQTLSVEIAGTLSSLLVIMFLLFFYRTRWHWQGNASSVPLPPQEDVRNAFLLCKSLIPYLIILISLFTVHLYLPLNHWLQTHCVITYAPIHLAFPLLAGPGVWILFAVSVALMLLSPSRVSVCSAVCAAWRQFIPVISTITIFLVVASLMQACGIIATLGNAVAPLGKSYLWLAPIIAWIGGWMTSSTVGGNALFIPLQRAISVRVGLPLSWMIPAQNASAAIASAISPARLTLLSTAIEGDGQEEKVRWEMGLVVAWTVGTITLCLAWFVLAWPLMLCLVLLVFYIPFLFWFRAGKLLHSDMAIFLPLRRVRAMYAGTRREMNIGGFKMDNKESKKGRFLAYGGIILVQLLYASFSPVAKPTLNRLDPTIFFCLTMFLLIPVALGLLVWWRRMLERAVFVRGAILGVCLGIGFLSLMVAFKDTSITNATLFSCVNGVIATLIAWLILRQRIQIPTWGACLFSVSGAIIVWIASTAHWQGNFTAFIGGSLFTIYGFLVEYLLVDDLRRSTQKLWPVLSVQLLTMAGIGLAFALCVGNWQTITALRPSDGVALGYTSVMATLVPLIFMPLLQRYVSAVTLAFFAVIEPLASAGIAFTFGERLSILGYLGFGIVLVGVMLQALVGARNPASSKGNASAPQTNWQGVDLAANTHARAGVRIEQRENQFIGRDSRAILAHLSSASSGGMDVHALQMNTSLSYAQLQHLLMSLRRRGYVVMNHRRRYELHPSYRPSVEFLWCA